MLAWSTPRVILSNTETSLKAPEGSKGDTYTVLDAPIVTGEPVVVLIRSLEGKIPA